MKILITGGAGFIGSAVVRHIINDTNDSVVNLDDTRKTKLTLQQINRVRKASELHDKEKKNEVEFVRQMYGMAAIAAAQGEGGGL